MHAVLWCDTRPTRVKPGLLDRPVVTLVAIPIQLLRCLPSGGVITTSAVWAGDGMGAGRATGRGGGLAAHAARTVTAATVEKRTNERIPLSRNQPIANSVNASDLRWLTDRSFAAGRLTERVAQTTLGTANGMSRSHKSARVALTHWRVQDIALAAPTRRPAHAGQPA